MVKKKILYPLYTEDTHLGASGTLASFIRDSLVKSGEIVLVENQQFYEELEYEGYTRGRSSITITFRSPKGVGYNMFLSDFDELLKAKDIVNKKVYGQWTFCKKGSNFGIKIVPEE